ncbi:MAG: hypothetical protein QM759_14860 [Terricaulis sp.]
MSGLRLIFAAVAFAGMVALCIIGFNYGGEGGLIGAGLGFVLRLLGGRGLDWGERLGNGYVGALLGMPLGMICGGLYVFAWPAVEAALNGPPLTR